VPLQEALNLAKDAGSSPAPGPSTQASRPTSGAQGLSGQRLRGGAAAKIGYCYFFMKDTANAKKALQLVLDRYPRYPNTEKVKETLRICRSDIRSRFEPGRQSNRVVNCVA